ncbi:hypothetical protein VTL71DRAFT_5685 [Oculimacula yallundae]|uniref:Uncharacterized protein n=1 Tax=Oculimacula yallundae TaxID=86028 RepID=A0ABR4BY90_9HELO
MYHLYLTTYNKQFKSCFRSLACSRSQTPALHPRRNTAQKTRPVHPKGFSVQKKEFLDLYRSRRISMLLCARQIAESQIVALMLAHAPDFVLLTLQIKYSIHRSRGIYLETASREATVISFRLNVSVLPMSCQV